MLRLTKIEIVFQFKSRNIRFLNEKLKSRRNFEKRRKYQKINNVFRTSRVYFDFSIRHNDSQYINSRILIFTKYESIDYLNYYRQRSYYIQNENSIH